MNSVIKFSLFGISFSLLTLLKLIFLLIMIIIFLWLLYLEYMDTLRYNEVNYLSCGIRKELVRGVSILGEIVVGIANIYSNYLSFRDEHFANDNKEEADRLNKEKMSVLESMRKRSAQNNYSEEDSALYIKYSAKTLAAEDKFKKADAILNDKKSLQDKISMHQEMLQKGDLELDNNDKSTLISEIKALQSRVKGKDEEFNLLINRIKKSREDFKDSMNKDNLDDKVIDKADKGEDNDKGGGSSIIRSPLDSWDKNFIDLIKDIRDNWYHNLNKLQQLCFSLLILNGVIFVCLVNICLTLFGEYLIKRFSLESRFPKLSKLILLRRKFQSYYLKFNILAIFIVVLSEMLFSIAVISL